MAYQRSASPNVVVALSVHAERDVELASLLVDEDHLLVHLADRLIGLDGAIEGRHGLVGRRVPMADLARNQLG